MNQPLVQLSTPIRSGELPQVVVRADSVPEVEEAGEILNALQERLAPAIKATAQALVNVPQETAQALSNLAQGGLNPQVVPQPYTPNVMPASAPAPSAQCPACSRNTACPECGGATTHRLKTSAAKNTSYNAHICAANDRHKVVWCTTPIKSALQGALNNPALIYG